MRKSIRLHLVEMVGELADLIPIGAAPLRYGAGASGT